MAEVVNLNQARKATARTRGKAKAAENRAAFGRTRAEKAGASAAKAKADALLDSHKREP